MNKRILLILCMLCCAAMLRGQQFERAMRNNFWNDGINAAGMRLDSLRSRDVFLSGDYEAGGFRSYSDPESRWSIGATARAITHYKKISLYGHFAFKDNEWYNVCGSMMRYPGKLPFNVIETTPGRKTNQSYTICGSLAADLDGGWTLGLKTDFKAENTAKRKDLRYSSFLLDLTVAPSILYKWNDCAMGASLLIHRTAETINAEQIGSAASTPKVFFDQGANVGYYQEWTGSNVHLSEAGVNGFPFGENLYGAGLQFQWRNVYADITGSYAQLTAGEKQTIWYRAGTPKVEANIAARFGAHSIRAHFDAASCTNRKTVIDKVTTGGITTTREFGYNEVLRRQSINANAEYELLLGKWEARTRLGVSSKKEIATPLYPYTYSYDRLGYIAREEVIFHIYGFDLTAILGYEGGKLTRDSYKVDAASGISTTPVQMSNASAELRKFDNLELVYIGSNRIFAELKIKYNFANGLYLEGAGHYLHAFAAIDSPYRWLTSLKFGYYF